MKTEQEIIQEAYISMCESADFYKNLSKTIGKPILKSAHERYKADGKKVPGLTAHQFDKSVEPQHVFDALKKLGFKKSKGYDSAPETWNMSSDHEAMTSRSSPVHSQHHSVHVELEHGSPMKVVVQDRSVK